MWHNYVINVQHSFEDSSRVIPMETRSRFLPPANIVCEGYVFTGVCLSTGGWGVRSRGHAWQAGMHEGACMVRGMCGRGVCVAGDVCGRGRAWQILRDTVIRSMSRRYVSYWNAFLSVLCLTQGKVNPISCFAVTDPRILRHGCQPR